MTSFESIIVVADLIFGLVMLVYGFAAGLFVAGWMLRKSANTKAEGGIFNREIHQPHKK